MKNVFHSYLALAWGDMASAHFVTIVNSVTRLGTMFSTSREAFAVAFRALGVMDLTDTGPWQYGSCSNCFDCDCLSRKQLLLWCGRFALSN